MLIQKNLFVYKIVCLMEKISDYLECLLSNFSNYIYGIYHKIIIDEQVSEKSYHNLLKPQKTEMLDVEELRKYIDLSDIKRLDM